ncbi:MAG: hypothetical protein ABSD68_01095 [Candidatus Micrarchaeales archaeon]
MSKIMAILGALLAWGSLFFAWWSASWSVSTPQGYGTGGAAVSMISLWNSPSQLSGTIDILATFQYENASGNGISLSNLAASGSSNLFFSSLIKSTIFLVIIGGFLGFIGGVKGYGNTSFTFQVFGGLAVLLALGLFLYGIMHVAGALNTTVGSSVLWHSESVSFQGNSPGTVSWGLSIGALVAGIGGFLVLLAPFIGAIPPSEPLEKTTSPSDAGFTGTEY